MIKSLSSFLPPLPRLKHTLITYILTILLSNWCLSSVSPILNTNFLVLSSCSCKPPLHPFTLPVRLVMSSPDYIIIGGGTSGLVVANRLSEDPDVQVLVLEAGQDLSADPRVNVPAFFTTLMGSDAAWQYQSVPQPGLGGRVIREPQGKALGGSSAINGQSFIAPGKAEIDAWAKMGNPGWDWAGLVPSYKKSYTLIPPHDKETLDHLGIDWINEEYRGTLGPVKVSFPGTKENPLCKAWIDAFREMNQVTTDGTSAGIKSSRTLN